MHEMTARTVAARAHLTGADLADAAVQRLSRRLAVLREAPETGAQAAEYAMLGGVSAAACTGLVYLLKQPETLSTIVQAITATLRGVIRGWF